MTRPTKPHVWLLSVNGRIVQNYLDLEAAQRAGVHVGRSYLRKLKLTDISLSWETTPTGRFSYLVLRCGPFHAVSFNPNIFITRYLV